MVKVKSDVEENSLKGLTSLSVCLSPGSSLILSRVGTAVLSRLPDLTRNHSPRRDLWTLR